MLSPAKRLTRGGREPHAPRSLLGEAFLDLLASRQNTAPRRLIEPGPGPHDLERLFEAAAAAPDHGCLTPWRFILVPQDQRHRLGDAFASALVERDAGATLVQIEAAREKAQRAPLLMVAILNAESGDGQAVSADERLVSLGCAIQNLLLAAHSLGFASGLTSGQAMNSRALRALLSLRDHERAICFVNIGTATDLRPPRARPEPKRFVSSL